MTIIIEDNVIKICHGIRIIACSDDYDIVVTKIRYRAQFKIFAVDCNYYLSGCESSKKVTYSTDREVKVDKYEPIQITHIGVNPYNGQIDNYTCTI